MKTKLLIAITVLSICSCGENRTESRGKYIYTEYGNFGMAAIGGYSCIGGALQKYDWGKYYMIRDWRDEPIRCQIVYLEDERNE